MKFLHLLFMLLFAVGCKKEDKCSDRSCVTIEIRDKHTDAYLPDFAYEINSNGIGGVNNHLVKTGKIEDGFASFPYTCEKYRFNELSVESGSLKGYFPDFQNSGCITDDRREFVFYFVTHENLKLVASNSNCLGANDKLAVQIKNSDVPGADKKYVTRYGCLTDAVIFDEPLSASTYEITWTVTRDNGVTNGSSTVELGETNGETITINY